MTLRGFVFGLITTILTGIPIIAYTSATDENEILIKRPFTIETEKEIVTAIKPDLGPIEQQEKMFPFDWNQQATIAESKKKIIEEEIFISKINDISQLSKEDIEALSRLFYKLGAYYTHVAREPELAIPKLMMAHALFNSIEDKTWSQNHLAYAYEQKHAANNQIEDKEKSLYYLNTVISERINNKQDKTLAFAYSVKGLIQTNCNDYKAAENSFKMALSIYESLPNYRDDQYARTKTRLANALLGQPGRDQEAIAILKQVKQYWFSKDGLALDPYAARCLISLAKAYMKTNKAKAACDELVTAITIYQNIYGNNSVLLVKPYELLAEAYKSIGKNKQAVLLKQKADDIADV